MNAFASVNEVYGSFFESDPPARVAIGVAALPRGAQVEIDAVVALARLIRAWKRLDPGASSGPWRQGPGSSARPRFSAANTLTGRAGAVVAFKAENLQRTGSFKLRGALAKIASLGDACARGVVCASAGNHAQAVAYAARSRNVPCEVFMPEAAAIAKVEAATSLGATVNLAAGAVEESLEHARARAANGGLAFVHPFDDPEVIAGQGGIGLELLAQVPDLERVIVPVGGGGLISGVATALKGHEARDQRDRRAARPGARGGDDRRRDRRQAAGRA